MVIGVCFVSGCKSSKTDHYNEEQSPHDIFWAPLLETNGQLKNHEN
jgi:hypothetical protein